MRHKRCPQRTALSTCTDYADHKSISNEQAIEGAAERGLFVFQLAPSLLIKKTFAGIFD
jgi:hypothetical protein